jgi:hypothetical protein
MTVISFTEARTNSYTKLVKAGQAIIQRQDQDNWVLGELASQVEIDYGEAKLETYAEDIGVDYTTLRHCRRTYEVWEVESGGRPPISFWTAYTLNGMDKEKRLALIKRIPNLTKEQARQKMEEYNEKKNAQKAEARRREQKKSKNKPEPKPEPQPSPEDERQKDISLWRVEFLLTCQHAATLAMHEDWSRFQGLVTPKMMEETDEVIKAWEDMREYLRRISKSTGV